MCRSYCSTGLVGLISAFSLCVACKSEPRPQPVSAEAGTIVRSWSSNHDVIPVWIGAEARFAAFWIFDTDTNNDGEIKAVIGDHGESLGDDPRLLLVDGQTQKIVSAENVIAVDPVGHFLIIEKAGKAVLFNARNGAQEELPDVDLESDHNHCERNRSASFDPTGRRIGWVKTDGTYVTRPVRGGNVVEFKSERRIWRGEPLAHADWAVLQTVEGDFPRMKTSCPALWSRGLARSSGRYGWDREFQTTLVREDGLQIDLTRRLLPLSRTGLLDVDKLGLEDVEGKSLGVLKHAFLGSEMVVVQGPDGLQMMNTDTLEQRSLPDLQFEVPIQILHHGREWVHGRNPKGESVRFHLRTGQVDLGPRIVGTLEAPHPSGWWGFKSDFETVIFWNLKTGQIMAIPVAGVQHVSGLSFSRRQEGQESWHTVDPTTGKFAKLGFRPQWTGETGCSMPNPISGIVKGLSVWCPHGQPEKSADAQ